MINVFLSDDHKLFLDGLKAILEKDSDIRIIGEALDGEALIAELENSSEKIDVLVLDIEMPKLNGVNAAKEIVERFPDIKILIISMYNKKNYIVNLMEIGVSGYVLKNKSKENFFNAIRQIHSGNPYFGLEVLTAASSKRNASEPKEPLTKREIEVLCKIGEGFTTNQIAKQLGIGQTTVNTYRRNLLLKLDKPNDKHLVRYAIKMGFIEL